jgi:hypothetical protein
MHPEETERYDEEVLDLPVSGFLAVFVFPFPPSLVLPS